MILTVGTSACTLLGSDEDPQEVRAVIHSVEAPAQVEAGTAFDVTFMGTTGCDQFSHVEQEREGHVLRFTAWAQVRDICPFVAVGFSVTKTLRLEQAGTYRIKADAVETTVEVN